MSKLEERMILIEILGYQCAEIIAGARRDDRCLTVILKEFRKDEIIALIEMWKDFSNQLSQPRVSLCNKIFGKDERTLKGRVGGQLHTDVGRESFSLQGLPDWSAIPLIVAEPGDLLVVAVKELVHQKDGERGRRIFLSRLIDSDHKSGLLIDGSPRPIELAE